MQKTNNRMRKKSKNFVKRAHRGKSIYIYVPVKTDISRTRQSIIQPFWRFISLQLFVQQLFEAKLGKGHNFRFYESENLQKIQYQKLLIKTVFFLLVPVSLQNYVLTRRRELMTGSSFCPIVTTIDFFQFFLTLINDDLRTRNFPKIF